MKISNRLKNKFEDILAQFTKREISNFFEDNDIENIIEEELPEGGVRRALVKQYYRSIDLNNPTDVNNVLQTFADIIADLEKRNEDYGFGSIDNPYTEQIELLKKNLNKDGWAYANGTIKPIEATTQQEQEVNPNISNKPTATTPETVTNTLSASDIQGSAKVSPPRVFVTYSWDGPEQERKVVDFTNFLRMSGFNAEIDKKLIQEQSAINFGKMMHQAFTDYDKVIIILSKGYKQKADKFMGGVGNEYTMLINDINKSPNKYILVSFEGILDEITPIGLIGRHIIDLATEENKTILFHKLLDKPLFEFADVASTLPVLETIKPSEFSLSNIPKATFEVMKINATPGNATKSVGKYDKVENDLLIELLNTSDKSINGFSTRIEFPSFLVENSYDYTIDGDRCIITHDSSNVVYPKQTKYTDKFTIRVTSRNYHRALDSTITVTVYSELGTSTKVFQLKEVFITGKPYGEIEYLIDAQFN